MRCCVSILFQWVAPRNQPCRADALPTGEDVPGEITELLEAWKAGDAGAGEEVIAMTYAELWRVAHAYLRRAAI